ncbi:BMP family protein [Ruminococcaceae bacterium OttesenSCG-928-D13]|nr:BMP family protein [Ruminococcaceae bacterium OttesenSCG-928-D13]
MKKSLALVLALVFVMFTLAACGGGDSSSSAAPASTGGDSTPAADSSEVNDGEGSAQAGDLKVAAIFGGAINDGNWNETQYNGLMDLKEKGICSDPKYMENVSDTDAAEAARTYASEGFNLVYLTTNSYQDYCTSVAESFPDTMFIQINGTYLAENFISVRIADEEQGFVQGVIAALLTETGKVGFVGGLEINPIKLGSSGFQQGVDYVNETYGLAVVAQRINTGSFTDVNQAKETAISLIEDGCDVVAPMANDASVGVMEAAEEKGAMAIGCGLGQDASAPTTTEVIVVKDVAIAYQVTGEDFANGILTVPAEVETYGANKGVVWVTDWFKDVDDEVKTRVEEVMLKLMNGEISISLDL